MIELSKNNPEYSPSILVIGIGGGGNNAIDRMIEAQVERVTFAAVNTDLAVLNNSLAPYKIPIGDKLLKGYGAGSDPCVGEAAAQESEDRIKEFVANYDMVITTCGMGGGTGTGAIPVISKIAKDMNILTVAVVTMPFTFENTPRMAAALNGIEKLKENVDTLLIIYNDKLLGLSDKPLMLDDAFRIADSVLLHTIESITNIVFNRGIVNIDFNDVCTTLREKGIGHVGIGTVSGNGSILDAVKQAVNSPLLNINISGAKNLIINTSGAVDIASLNDAIEYVKEISGSSVNIIWGTVKGTGQSDEDIVVTVIATGMPETHNAPVKEKPALPKYKVTKSAHRNVSIEIPPFLREYT